MYDALWILFLLLLVSRNVYWVESSNIFRNFEQLTKNLAYPELFSMSDHFFKHFYPIYESPMFEFGDDFYKFFFFERIYEKYVLPHNPEKKSNDSDDFSWDVDSE